MSQVALSTVFDPHGEGVAVALPDGVEPPPLVLPHAAITLTRASADSPTSVFFQPRADGRVITGRTPPFRAHPGHGPGEFRPGPSVAGGIHMIKPGSRMIPFC